MAKKRFAKCDLKLELQLQALRQKNKSNEDNEIIEPVIKAPVVPVKTKEQKSLELQQLLFGNSLDQETKPATKPQA